MLCHMKAVLAFHDKQVLPDGAIVEMKIWNVATPVAGSTHRLNIEDRQERYVFKTVELLIADFLADVRGLRGER